MALKRPLTPERKDAIIWSWRNCSTVLGIVTAIASCVYAYHNPKDRLGAVIIGSFWTFVPPAWFMFEYGPLFRWYGDLKDKDDLKYGQGLATKFWGGVAILLAVIYKFPQFP
jgi:hypothetical protein